jgi:hypothetical protein
MITVLLLANGFVLPAFANGQASKKVPLEVKRLRARRYVPLEPGPVILPTPQPAIRRSVPRYRKRRLPLSTMVYPGSLRDNIVRIARHFGWRTVVWQAPYDFNWVGKARIRAANLPQLLLKLLHDYPLQAVLYRGNHVLAIYPRNIKQ